MNTFDWDSNDELDSAFLDWDFLNGEIKRRKKEFIATLDDILALPCTTNTDVPIEELI